MAQRQPFNLALIFAAVAVAGCGAAEKPAEDEFTRATVPVSTAEPAKDTPPAKADDSGGLTEDQRAQMEIALRRGGDKASNCATVVPDAPRGEGEVKVTFDGKKGRAVDVTVGPPWAGTPAESCIKRSFVGEIIVPFDGELEVPYTVKLPPKGEDPSKVKDDKSKPKDKKK